MYSNIITLITRLLKILSKERKKSLYQIIPLAVISGITDVLVLGLVSRLFIVLVGKENRPSIPFTNFLTEDPFVRLIILISIYISLNWIVSFLRLTLRSFKQKLTAEIFIDLSQIAQRNIFNQNYDIQFYESLLNILNKHPNPIESII